MYKLIILYTLWRTITTARGTEGGFSLSFRVRAVHGGKNNIYIYIYITRRILSASKVYFSENASVMFRVLVGLLS